MMNIVYGYMEAEFPNILRFAMDYETRTTFRFTSRGKLVMKTTKKLCVDLQAV